MKKVAIMGFGTVGSGVAEVLTNHPEIIAKNAGEPVEIKYILDLRDFPDSPFAKYIVHDFEQIVNDPEVSVVAEVIGGTKPALDFTRRCLEAKKHVVTSNKELVATYGDQLLAIAEKNNVNYMFEASVGGGIPIIRPMNQCLAANEIDEIRGILNGTTNYILDQMIKQKKSFKDALADAQKNGYAEANPAADIEGIDACRKIAILTSMATGYHVHPDSVHTEGISGVSLRDVDYADAAGRVVKLIGRSVNLGNGRQYIIVSPHMLKKSDPMASVDDVFNAIMIHGDAVGDVMFYGRGAGKLPTASAVTADIIDCVKHDKRRRWMDWAASRDNSVIDYLDFDVAYYVRMWCSDKAGAEKAVSDILGSCEYIKLADAPAEEAAFMTGTMREGDIQEKLAQLEKCGAVSSIESRIRLL